MERFLLPNLDDSNYPRCSLAIMNQSKPNPRRSKIISYHIKNIKTVTGGRFSGRKQYVRCRHWLGCKKFRIRNHLISVSIIDITQTNKSSAVVVLSALQPPPTEDQSLTETDNIIKLIILSALTFISISHVRVPGPWWVDGCERGDLPLDLDLPGSVRIYRPTKIQKGQSGASSDMFSTKLFTLQ